MELKTNRTNFGVVASIRGSVIDVRFDDALPPIYSLLRTGDESRIIIEVLAQRDERHVRGIALTPTQGLARGMSVEDTGGTLKAPVGKEILSRMFDVFGNVIDRGPALPEVAWQWRQRRLHASLTSHTAWRPKPMHPIPTAPAETGIVRGPFLRIHAPKCRHDVVLRMSSAARSCRTRFGMCR